MKKHLILIGSYLLFSIHSIAQDIVLANNNTSSYKIVVPRKIDSITNQAVNVLRGYFRRVTGISLEIITEDAAGSNPAIVVGPGRMTGDILEKNGVKDDGFAIIALNKNLVIAGKGAKGTLYGVYTFIEQILGCRKWWAGAAHTPQLKSLSIPSGTKIIENPGFHYRQAFYPPSVEQEYLDWHKLQRFTDLWGLWSHSFDKLVPPSTYYKEHPEYFALVNKTRKKTQLCLSNDTVVDIAAATLSKMMAANPRARYWSIAANDGGGFCECDRCKITSNHEGGPQGPLISFVNKVANRFPDKTFTTLAYSYTVHAPKTLSPAKNVIVILSNTSTNKALPLAQDPSAKAFLADLKAWKSKTPNLYIWEYVTQFSNYLTPYPVLETFQPNIKLYSEFGIGGVFAQGSGNVYSDMAELKSYVLAKLLWNPGINADKIINQFIDGFYGKAAPSIKNYVALLNRSSTATKSKLLFQGNPVEGSETYLSRTLMPQYNNLLDNAAKEVVGDATISRRVANVRLSYDYAYLQLARFYGLGNTGVFVSSKDRSYTTNDTVKKIIARFEDNALKAGAIQLSEGGATPKGYVNEWQNIISEGVKKNIALNAKTTLASQAMPDYSAKGARTLTDGTRGYTDFTYNYLCFRNNPMIATIDLGKPTAVNTISVTFLETPSRLVFRPQSVQIEVSQDGRQYKILNKLTSPSLKEDYTVRRIPFDVKNQVGTKVRFIKVTANPFKALPAWRYFTNSYPIIACDEIWVQ